MTAISGPNLSHPVGMVRQGDEARDGRAIAAGVAVIDPRALTGRVDPVKQAEAAWWAEIEARRAKAREDLGRPAGPRPAFETTLLERRLHLDAPLTRLAQDARPGAPADAGADAAAPPAPPRLDLRR